MGADVAAQTTNFNSTASSAQLTMIIVGLLAGLLGFGLAFIVARSLVARTRAMLAAADGIASGDVEQSIEDTSRDELGATAAAFRRMVEYLRRLAGATERIAGGDLTTEVEVASERDVLGRSVSTMVSNLRDLVGDV